MGTPSFGIIGLGRMGRRHLEAFEAAGFHFRGFVDPAIAAQSDSSTTCQKYVSAPHLAKDVDLVIIATPSCSHARVLLEVAAHAQNVLVEKPACASFEDVLALDALRARSNIFVAQSERFHHAVEELTTLISPDVDEISFRRVASLRNPDAHPLLELAVHDLDLAAMLLGNLELKSAHEERGLVTLELVTLTGTPVTIISGTAHGRAPVREVVVRGPRPIERRICLLGSAPEVAEKALIAQARAMKSAMKGQKARVASLGDGLVAAELAMRGMDWLASAKNLVPMVASC